MLDLLFLEKKFDVIDYIDNETVVGGIFMFENLNKEHGEYIDNEYIPDYILIMIAHGEVQQAKSGKIDEKIIIDYFTTTYTKEQLIELNGNIEDDN